MRIRDEIFKAVDNFYVENARPPTHLYLGYEELDRLLADAETQFCTSFARCKEGEETVYGMVLFRVITNSHLKCY